MNVRGFLREVWREMWRDYRSEFAYLRALDDVYDYALDRHNPCHDEVREWIRARRPEVTGDEPLTPSAEYAQSVKRENCRRMREHPLPRRAPR